MKNLTLGLILCVAAPALAVAQNSEKYSSVDNGAQQSEANAKEEQRPAHYFGRFKQFGLHLGPNANGTSAKATQSVEDPSGRTRMLVGADAVFELTSFLGFQPEFNYVQRGFEEKVEVTALTTRLRVASLDYIEIPLLLRIEPHFDTLIFRTNLTVGPSIGVLASSGVSITDRNPEGANTVVSDSARENAFNSFYSAFNIGLGGEFDLTSSFALSVDLRYSMGLSNMASNEQTPFLARELKTNSFQLLAGLQVML